MCKYYMFLLYYIIVGIVEFHQLICVMNMHGGVKILPQTQLASNTICFVPRIWKILLQVDLPVQLVSHVFNLFCHLLKFL